MDWIVSNLYWLIPAATAVVALTPNKKDDLIAKKVFRFFRDKRAKNKFDIGV